MTSTNSYEERQNEREALQHKRELELAAHRVKMAKVVGMLVFSMFLVLVALFCISPIYGVWSSKLAGEAEFVHAESNRRIKVLEAQASQEAAKSLAHAEVIRAEGVAQANKIIGGSLQNNEGYLRYLWIQGLQTNQMQVVYIPTEANLPIMEASRMAPKASER